MSSLSRHGQDSVEYALSTMNGNKELLPGKHSGKYGVLCQDVMIVVLKMLYIPSMEPKEIRSSCQKNTQENEFFVKTWSR